MFIKLLNDHLNGLIKTAGNEKKKNSREGSRKVG
jgi:hypothetical protein